MSENAKTLAELDVPGPTTTALTEPFWDAAANGTLVIQECQACGTVIFYPRNICTKCWSSDLDWVRASGGGRLKSFSQVHRPGHPGWSKVAPYFVILVELDEGPTMLSHLVGETDGIAVGDRLQFRPVNIGGRTLPCFEPSK